MSLSRISLLVLGTVVVLGCAPRPQPVSPADVEELAARAEREPTNGAVQLRYAAALRSADRCDDALVAARRGMSLAPSDALGPLVVGQCQEAAGSYDDAVATYRTFLAASPDGRGSSAVRARELLATREAANAAARDALSREAELSQQPADPQTLAVLPVQVVGDEQYAPLSRGLAQMLTSDLALLERFRLVERMRLGALLNEMEISQTSRVDPSTAARVGRLAQAGRMVQGLALIPNESETRLEASVVTGTGEVTAPARADGRFRDLLKMEKELIVGIAGQLGYTLSDAERQAILENGTQDMTAFLAYSRALEAEDRGDFQAAAAFYSQAVQADPGFQQARDGFQASQSAPEAQASAPGDATVLAGQDVVPAVPEFEDPGGAIGATVTDLAPTTIESTTAQTTTQTGTTTTTANPIPPSVIAVVGTIRIVFVLP